jgi:hypothetical protein
MSATIEIENTILGDNQFFGVNHMSEEKGQKTRERFKDIGEIKKMLYTALDLGVKSVFFSAHPDIDQITDMMRKDRALKNDFSIYVNIPYIVKYISMVNAMGIPDTVKYMLRGKTSVDNLLFFAGMAKSILTMDYMGIANKLVDVEMSPFRDLNVKAIFLHNTLCDLCLGYELIHVIKRFDAHIKKKYDAVPAYGTLNLPAFCKILDKADINQSLIMTAVNKKGFFMNPGKSAYEEVLKNTNHSILAMATLASGALKPTEAYEYLSQIGIKHVVVGLSSKEHADETFSVINKYIVNS